MNDRLTVAILLSCDTFESFFGRVLNLNARRYLDAYRNDWSWYYAKGLAENGVRPVLYLPSLHERGLHRTDAGVDVRFLPVARWYVPLAKLRRACRATRWSLYAQERVNAMAFLRPLRDALAEDDARVLYCQEYWGGRFDHVVRRVPVPVVAADHGGVCEGVVKWFKRSAMRQARALYGQTARECRKIEAHDGRAVLLPNGCDVERFRPDSSVERTKTVLTIARLTDKQKRTSDLIRAMSRLSADWTLDVVGTGPDRAALEALAAKLGVASRVRFHGFQDRTAVLRFLRQCGVYAMPSAHEGFCIAMLEAMGCGASVVGSGIPSFEAVIKDGVNGRLAPVGDPVTLAAAIEDAWKCRADYGRRAVTMVHEHFDTRRLYRQLADSLRAAAGGSTRAMAFPSPNEQQVEADAVGAMA